MKQLGVSPRAPKCYTFNYAILEKEELKAALLRDLLVIKDQYQRKIHTVIETCPSVKIQNACLKN